MRQDFRQRYCAHLDLLIFALTKFKDVQIKDKCQPPPVTPVQADSRLRALSATFRVRNPDK